MTMLIKVMFKECCSISIFYRVRLNQLLNLHLLMFYDACIFFNDILYLCMKTEPYRSNVSYKTIFFK